MWCVSFNPARNRMRLGLPPDYRKGKQRPREGSVRSSGCLLFAVLDPDEQEVVVEVPRVVQNPPKPVMTTRPTAVKATGIVVFFWFFLIHCLQYLSLGSNCVCIWCFDECFSKFILPLNGNLTSL